MSRSVVAVIPTYRPDAPTLDDLVSSLVTQGIPLLISDDASPCTADRTLRSAREAGADLIRHRRNAGIARSLNHGLRFAADQKASWLLTLDQDSAIEADHVERLLAAADAARGVWGADLVGGVAAGGIVDASGALGYPITERNGVPTTEEVIQTGTLWAVEPLLARGGFDEHLGIDAVDAAACLTLRSAGLHVVLAQGVTVAHRIGDGRQLRLLGREVLSSGHSPARRTTIVRNRLRLFPSEFAESPRHAFRTVRRVLVQTALAVTVEDDRWAKAKASARGLLPARER